MKLDAAVAFALALPGAYPDSPWGEDDNVAKVGGKIFVFFGGEPDAASLTLKNDADVIDEWRTRYPDHATVPRYLAKSLWNQISTKGKGAPTKDEVEELIEDSYRLVVAKLPKAKRPA